jgi:YD repeat-containing protein
MIVDNSKTALQQEDTSLTLVYGRTDMVRLILLVFALGVFPLSARQQPDEIRYTYDKNGRVTRADYSNGRAIIYTYDPAGNLVRRAFVAPEPEPTDAPPENAAQPKTSRAKQKTGKTKR